MTSAASRSGGATQMSIKQIVSFVNNKLMPKSKLLSEEMFPTKRAQQLSTAAAAADCSAFRELVLVVYRALLQCILDVDKAVFEQPPIACLGALPADEHELFGNAIPPVLVAIAVDSVLNDLSSSVEFSMSDVVRPDSKRTLRIWSELIYLVEYKESRTPVVSKVIDERNGLLQHLARLRQDNEKKGGLVEERRRRKKLDDDHAKEQDKKIEEKKRQCGSLTDRGTELTRQTAALEREVQSEAGALDELQRQAERADAELEALAANVVSSPEKLRARVDELMGDKATLAAELEQLRAHTSELREQLKRVTAVDSALRLLHADVDRVEREMENGELKVKARDEWVDELAKARADLQDEQRTVDEKRNELQHAQEQLERQKRQHAAKSEQHVRRVEQLRRQVKEAREQNAVAGDDLEERIESARAQIDKTQADCAAAEQRGDEEMAKLEQLMHDVEAETTLMLDACEQCADGVVNDENVSPV